MAEMSEQARARITEIAPALNEYLKADEAGKRDLFVHAMLLIREQKRDIDHLQAAVDGHQAGRIRGWTTLRDALLNDFRGDERAAEMITRVFAEAMAAEGLSQPN